MSSTTFAPATADPDDFDRWEQEIADDTRPVYRPTRAAERREAQQQIDEQLGLFRHRSSERWEDR